MKSKVVSQLILLCCFLIALFYFSLTPLLPDSKYQWTMMILTAIGTISFFIIQKEQYGKFHWLSITTIFIFGYFIVFYQMILLNLVGYEVPNMFFSFIWAGENVINRSLGISTLGLLAFYLGMSNFKKYKSNKVITRENKETATNSITFILFFAYLFYVMFLLNSGSYIYGEYTPDDASGAAAYFYKLFNVSLIAAIVVKVSYITSLNITELSYKKYLSYFRWPLLVLLSWHIIFSLFVGDRGPVIFLVLISSGIYFIRWGKVKLHQAIIGIFILSIVMTLIGEIRQNRFSGAGYGERVVSAFTSFGASDKTSKKFDEYVPGDQTIELALSVRTLNHAIYNVPDKYDYMYGLFQLKYFYSIIPGLAGKINMILFDGEKKFDGSSNFVTYLIQGEHPSSGEGSSIVADFYLDFGVVGVIIGLFLFGLFVSKNEYKLFSGYQRPTFLWITTLMFFANALYVNRSALLLILSNVVLIYVMIRINAMFVSHFRSNGRKHIPKSIQGNL